MLRSCLLSLTFMIICAAPAAAQEDGSASEPPGTIIVTSGKISGSVDTIIPPTLELNAADIASYGASSVTDLLAALGPQTRSGGGRNSGPPIVLLNGRRVSGFAEMRDLPPEAILKVEVFPEEVATKLGFAPDQRVVNFILKPGFSAFSGEVEQGGPFAGGRSETEVQATWLKVTEGGRINLSAQVDRDTKITEAERGIVQPGVNSAPFRTLLPSSDAVQLNSIFNRAFANGNGVTLNLRYDRGEEASLFGLPGGIFPVSGAVDPLERHERTGKLHAGLTLDGNFGRWRWTFTSNADRATVRTLIDRNSLIDPLVDRATSRITTVDGLYSLAGSPFRVPAGPVSVNLRAGFDRLSFDSQTISATAIRRGAVDRGIGTGRINIDLPLTSRREGFGAALGDLSLNANYGYRRLTDFGGLTNYGYGLTWSPIKGLTATASFSAEDAAPTPQQLGNPLIVTPNVTVFDFVRGETVQVRQTSGGNPLLQADERRDIKLGLTYSPPSLPGLSVEGNYFRIRSTNPVSGFPALGSAIEAGFPGRIQRDLLGRLVAVDVRAVNFAQTRSDTFRWGVSFSKSIGPQGQGPGTRAGGGGPGARDPGGARPGGFGGRRGGGPGGFGPGGAGGRWSLSLFHSLKLKDEVLIARTVPALDLLNGDVIGQNGGSPRHTVDLEGGWFSKGLGFRVTGSWRSGTDVTSATTNALRFSSVTLLNLRAFLNFDQRKGLIKQIPLLKGSRLALRLNNVFDDVQSVRDASGAVPFRYQSGYLDPLGRTWEVSFRKLF